jgi:hypothetical protein
MPLGIDIEIDTLVPCLIDVATGGILDTVYSRAGKDELKGLKKKGWLINWDAKDFHDAEIYKILIKGDTQIQGLVALTDTPKDKAVYINFVESAPHNRGESKKYKGVGGHLFAIAVKRSIDLGYDGFLYMDAKDMDLVEYYEKALDAAFLANVDLAYRMIIDENAAKKILSEYTLQEEV